jgi:hypothetical protein
LTARALRDSSGSVVPEEVQQEVLEAKSTARERLREARFEQEAVSGEALGPAELRALVDDVVAISAL